jgi:hypothetical protein
MRLASFDLAVPRPHILTIRLIRLIRLIRHKLVPTVPGGLPDFPEPLSDAISEDDVRLT